MFPPLVQAMPQLTGWRFDPNSQQLALFATGTIQPRVQVIENPGRIVVDLPDTDLFAPTEAQVPRGPVRRVRAGQLDPKTTRMVMEFDGDSVPMREQVRVRRVTSGQWLVQLLPNIPPPPTPLPQIPATPAVPGPTPTGRARAQITGIEIKSDGFLIKTTERVRADARRLEELPPRVVVDIEDAQLARSLVERSVNANQLGVARVRLAQFQDDPAIARVVLDLSDPQSSWEARYSPELGGVLVRPAAAVAQPVGTPITLQSAQLTPEGIVFSADQPPRFTTGWENPNEYRLVFTPAQLPENFVGPVLDVTSPIDNLKINQTDERTVVALIRVLPGTRVGDPRALDPERRRILIPLIQRGQDSGPLPGTESFGVLPNGNGTRVVLDAGHGGKDPGAQRFGVNEKDLTLDIVRRLNNKLRELGFNTTMTRGTDNFISLGDRVSITNANQAQLFVSIHINAMPARDDIQGIETYYSNPRSARLAYVLHRRLVARTGKPDRGVRVRSLYVTRQNSVPAVLLEVGFISNAAERNQLVSADYQNVIVEAVAQGLQEYLR